MRIFLDVALGYPTAVFTLPLVVLVGYWLLVVLGVVDPGDAGDGGAGGAGDAGDGDGGGWLGGLLGSAGLGGVPVLAVLSLLVAVAWFVSLAGAALLRGPGGGPDGWLALPAVGRALVGTGILAVAVAVAWAVTALLVRPLRRIFTPVPAASRRDFVGRPCVVRTGRVTAGFGQAEVTAPDGSSAIVQVRQPEPPDDALRVGSAALIFDYDADGEFFWIVPLGTDGTPPPPKDQ